MSKVDVETKALSLSNEAQEASLHKKKQKHNARRRRSKKKENVSSNHLKVDDVVNFLCSSIVSAEPVTNHNRTSFDDGLLDDAASTAINNLPSTSGGNDLTDLFGNLQIHASKVVISPDNITEFLNIDLLKETNCESLSVEELERIKSEKASKVLPAEGPSDIPKEKVGEYFNLNLIRKSPEQTVLGKIESGSLRLVEKLESTIQCPDECEKAKSDKYLGAYFNLNALTKTEDNIVTSIKSTSKLFVSELEKTLLNSENSGKISKSRKKSKKGKNVEEPSEGITGDGVFDGKQKVYHNSALSNKKEKTRPKTKEDVEFPKYLSPEELESVSKFGVLLTGIIRINQKNYKEAYITAPDKGMDILIEGLKDRNRALEGDEVYFVLKPKEHHRAGGSDASDVQRTAVVVGIKTINHNRKAIGLLKSSPDKNNHFVWFSPRDSRLPRIKLKREALPPGFFQNVNRFSDKLYFAKILKWNDMRFAEGELIKEVGMAGDVESETAALLLKYDLDVTPYSESLNKFFPTAPFRIPQEELAKREDFRGECIFTIDPATARDLDDAVSCKKLPNGNYEVGVHISDVSYFLQEGTPLDEAVKQRATTVYLVQEVYHMLPRELCQMCSLTPGEDKLSFSVLWEITPQFKIVKSRFVRSVINSCAQLSYEQVQNVLDQSKNIDFPIIHGGHRVDSLAETIRILNEMAKHFRQQRFFNGALKIEQTKICFALDEEGKPREYFVYRNQESHRLIEEFMLLANITVAERIEERFPKIAFLRSHSPPLIYVLEKLQKNLEKYGIILDVSSSGALQSSITKYSGDDVGSLARMLVLNNALAKPMARAKYYCAAQFPKDEDRRHYALNVPLYTHFTSPIRRYADVMVHRLLAACSGYRKPPNWAIDQVQGIAANCNKQKYAAKMASEVSTELFLSVYIGLKGSVISDAVVCDIKDKSFDCIVLSTGAHQRIYYEHIEGKLTQEDDDGISRLKILWPQMHQLPETTQIIEMFTIIKIELKRSNVLKIEARLLRPE